MDVMEDSYRKKMGLGQDGNALIRLIVFNAILFVILEFILLIFKTSGLDLNGYHTIFNWFVLPADIEKLAAKPWAILTYSFTESDVFKFIGNMLWLWGFGYIMQDLTGNRKLVPIYIYGTLVAAFFYMLSHYIFPNLHAQLSSSAIFGADPAVMAIVIATTTVAPDYRIFPMINGGIPLWVLTVIYILISFSSIPLGNSGRYIADITAGGMGFFFIYQARRGNDLGAWMNNFFDWCNDLFDPEKKQKNKSSKHEFHYKVSGTQPFKKIPNITQKRIDDILDKINQQGYRYLTEEEKDILKRAADKEDL
jgi:membrane associated rhomboid family serine protease